MPTYEYECDACEHRFAEFQSMSDQPLKKCPECAKPKLRRLIGAGAGLVFKGSGFYINDYGKKSGNGGGEGKDGGSGASGEPGAASKSEAKTESKSESKSESSKSESKPTTKPKPDSKQAD